MPSTSMLLVGVLSVGMIAATALPASAAVARDDDDDRDRGRSDDSGRGRDDRDDRVELRRSGACSAAARWDLTVKQRDGGLEVEFEVDANRRSQRWTYVITVDGNQVASGARRTGGRSGSWSVETRAGGGGVVTARAARVTGRSQICLATVSI